MKFLISTVYTLYYNEMESIYHKIAHAKLKQLTQLQNG